MRREIREGLALVLGHPILRPLTLVSTCWFVVFQGWIALQTLYATRELGLSAGELGVAHMAGGAGALLSSFAARHVTRRLGTGVPILLGVACSALAWWMLALMPRTDACARPLGAAMLVFDFGAVLYGINYLSLRQAITPDRLLGPHDRDDALPHGGRGAARLARRRPRGRGVGLARDVRRDGRAGLRDGRAAVPKTDLRHVPDVALLEAARRAQRVPGKHRPPATVRRPPIGRRRTRRAAACRAPRPVSSPPTKSLNMAHRFSLGSPTA